MRRVFRTVSVSTTDVRTSRLLIPVAAAALLATTIGLRATAAQGAPQRTAEEEEAFAAKAEALAYRVCDECHALDEVAATRRTVRDWRSSVTSMVSKGAVATKDQLAMITEYLIRYYGLVGVNTASPEDLSAVLGLSPKDAQAIVEHRTAKGRFADKAALLGVPGIDKSKIEAQSDAVRFD
jgi:competence ComEA-like helix-hairpin-helix protein